MMQGLSYACGSCRYKAVIAVKRFNVSEQRLSEQRVKAKTTTLKFA